MCEEKQDLEDYIQYNFDGIASFKLAIFVNSGKIEVKFAFGQVEEGFAEELVKIAEHVKKSPETATFHLKTREFSRKAEEFEFDRIFCGICEDSRIFVQSAGDNTFIVYCCGKTSGKDEPHIRQLIHGLLC